ncbi:MAG: hypothetical protein IIY07_00025, partial [Thermoguttaceae bacterium]|nr:hypothetical protein [Thermoguttaceae bacterium]
LASFGVATVGGGTQRERRFLKNVARTRSFFERRALTSGRRVDFNAEKSASFGKRGLRSRPVGVLFPMKNGSI